MRHAEMLIDLHAAICRAQCRRVFAPCRADTLRAMPRHDARVRYGFDADAMLYYDEPRVRAADEFCRLRDVLSFAADAY